MARLKLVALCMLQIALAIRTEGHYTVVGPGTLHSERKYNVAVSAHHKDGPKTLVVGIEGTSFNETKSVQLQPNETKLVEFDVPHLEEGSYNLTTSDDVAGKSHTRLNMVVTTSSIRIQTDKGQYQPGDIVNYRLLFLNENLKPDKPSKNTVMYIQDAHGNRVHEVRNFKVVKGVHTGTFEISESPILGSWSLRAEAETSTKGPTVNFKVSPYDNSKFNVDVSATNIVNVKDGQVQVVVRANYTYGKLVKGKATVWLEVDNMHDLGTDLGIPPVLSKTADLVGGRAKFDFEVKEWESFLPYERASYIMKTKATVEEILTGVKGDATTTGLCYNYRYMMRCTNMSACMTVHAETEVDVPISIRHTDGTPVTDRESVAKLTYKENITQTYPTNNARKIEYDKMPTPVNPNRTFVYEAHVNDSGIAVFKVKLPELEHFEYYDHYFYLDVEYKDEKQSLSSIYQEKQRENPQNPVIEPEDWLYVTIVKTANNTNYTSAYTWPIFKMGEEATIQLNSSVPLSYFIYNIIARANIVSSVRVDLPDKPNIYEFKILTTFDMANFAKIYVYYVDEAGGFHHSDNTFKVQLECQNTIEITTDNQAKPGQDVTLRIKTTPDSYVGLMAYDPIALSLGAQNDLSTRSMEGVLNSYTTHTPPQGYNYIPGQYSGVVTLTNANDFYNQSKPVRTRYLKAPTMYHSTIIPDQGQGSTPERAVDGWHTNLNTWIFDDIENTKAEEFTWTKKIPDTVNSWVITGFSLNAERGLGFTKQQTSITTLKPLDLLIRLPYSVQRGEVLNIPAVVFNYLNEELDVQVTLDNKDDEYEFLDVAKEIIREKQQVKNVRLSAQNQSSVSFMIRPKIVGSVMLKFTAVSPMAGDTIIKTLKVEPVGVTQYYNKVFFVDLLKQPSFMEKFVFKLPENVVADSAHMEISVVGDLLGPLVQNLEKLLRLPMAGGEQIMTRMIINYFTLRYLERINRLTPALETKIKRNLETGYQNIQKYRLSDGSFRPFNPITSSTKAGSTWFTAHVVRSLHQMKQFISLEESIHTTALNFLKKQQAPDGSFVETGRYFRAEERGNVSLTAITLLAFIEANQHREHFAEPVAQGLNFLVQTFKKTDSLHSKVLTVYALHVAMREEAVPYLATLRSLAMRDGDHVWWGSFNKTSESSLAWGPSGDVETTSYMLLSLLDMESKVVEEVLPTVKWLVAHRNSYGGFYSTRDTMVGVQALIKFAEKSNYEPAMMDIHYTAEGEREKNGVVKVNDENRLEQQLFELPEKTRTIAFEATGKGLALLQVSYRYNTVEQESQPSFQIKTTIINDTALFKLEMDVCVNYTEEIDLSTIAVLEISLPSGYVADSDNFRQLMTWRHVRRVETKNAESIILIYYEHLKKGEVYCLPIAAIRSHAVTMQKPASIVLYDYYNPSTKATISYEVASKECDNCEED